MAFDYGRQTREHYQDAAVAQAYHAEFTKLRGLNGLRFRLVANRERRVTRDFLRRVGARRVIDVPSGTGKMAPIYADLRSEVLAMDISAEMLEIARQVYGRLDYHRARFVVADAESIKEATRGEQWDAIVCIRLMHRVPLSVRGLLLEQFSKTCPHLIVSYGLTSVFQSTRRAIRRVLIGGRDVSASQYPTYEEVRSELERFYTIVDDSAVLPALSGERVFLLSSR